MYVARIPNPIWLIRESKWVNGKVVQTTLAHITKLPPDVILGIRKLLKGGAVVDQVHPVVQEVMADVRRFPHGPVAAPLAPLRPLQLEALIRPRAPRIRNLVRALMVRRILNPTPKLATAAALRDGRPASSLGAELGLDHGPDHAVYPAMDWLYKRKGRIEKQRAARPLRVGSIVLCDTSFS